MKIDEMSMTQIQEELRSYQPSSAPAVITDEAFMERRQALWRRLDQMVANRSKEQAA